jgi:hypothetical protein
MPSVYNRERRRFWFERQQGKCCWCDKPMLWIERWPAERSGDTPLLMCTLEHLRTRADSARRDKPAKGERRTAAACFQCNRLRASGRYWPWPLLPLPPIIAQGDDGASTMGG